MGVYETVVCGVGCVVWVGVVVGRGASGVGTSSYNMGLTLGPWVVPAALIFR